MTTTTNSPGPFDWIADGVVKGQERAGPLRVVFVPAAVLICVRALFPADASGPAIRVLDLITQFGYALALVAGASILARSTGLGRPSGYDALMTELGEPSILLGVGALWTIASVIDPGNSLLWFLGALPFRLVAIALIFLAPIEKLTLVPALKRSGRLLLATPLRFIFTLVMAAAATATVLGFGFVLAGNTLGMCGVPTQIVYAGLLLLLWPYVVGALSACVWSVRR